MSTHPGISYLTGMPQYATGGAATIRPGLDRITRLLAHLGSPQESYPIIHVAGTNGKGSTCSFAASLLTASGLRCGLHTSPHLVQVGERMRVDGRPASEESVGDAVTALRPLIEEIGASYFEVTVALSLRYFADRMVDVAVVEVGLGGRLDATNILSPRVCAITHIAVDHAAILGSRLEDIAREKAGIIKQGVPVVIGLQEPSVMEVLRAEAALRSAPVLGVVEQARWEAETLWTPRGVYQGVAPGIPGEHQLDNAACAVLAVEEFLGSRLDSASEGLRSVRDLAGLRGRYETWSERPLVVLDVGHNPDAVIPALRRFAGTSPSVTDPPAGSSGQGRHVVAFALMADKELDPIAALMAELRLEVEVVALDSPRAIPPRELANRLLGAGVTVKGIRRMVEFSELVSGLSPDSALLVVGSHQLVGGFLSEMEPGHSRPALQSTAGVAGTDVKRARER